MIEYADRVASLVRSAVGTIDNAPEQRSIDGMLSAFQLRVKAVTDAGHTIFFVGNGGSAAVASHLSIDFLKAGYRATALHDPAVLTALANDDGYPQVFSEQIKLRTTAGDMVIAISSSGNSANIYNAAVMAIDKGCYLVTFSGFGSDNALRTLGNLNFYLPSRVYGLVEIGHLIMCHSIVEPPVKRRLSVV